MPPKAGLNDGLVGQAAALAREFAPELDAVLLTHFPDAETLDLYRTGDFRLGEADLATVTAVNRAVAAELAANGVRVFVQRADRGAFRRWMDGRIDTVENRLAWRDRARMLSGAAALEALGLDARIIPAQPRLGTVPGPLADSLLAAFAEEDGAGFEALAHALLAGGRAGVLELAVRKAADRLGEDMAEDLVGALLAVAEGAEAGPSGWAELVALPVALVQGEVPEAAALGSGLIAAGILPATLELRFLPGWRSPEAVARLDPAAMRRVLLDLVAGMEPRDLPPADTDELADAGFGVLLGVQLDWTIPSWEEIAAEGPPDEEAEEDSPEDAKRTAAFDRWRAATFEAGGCVPLALVPPSEIGDEVSDFLGEAGQETAGIEEIRDFVAMARQEAPGEEIVCRPEVVGDGLELSLYTAAGRFLDSLSLAADELPARAEEMPRLIEAFVVVVKDAPGR
ncbi:hypothetical protein ACFQY5_12620 [Paeniroseomonas aquatica]|uniref:Uncharacterized protein n=1 Tax=Paeniroseomonas aquatica TaxID=373043 RepID=A0ABT8ADM3_9PROT|nr:hypothetical protein [Paeniroseomonas aquatica]MDN3567643.1 hypothetical protein [Paeniroseomonas aquatica]